MPPERGSWCWATGWGACTPETCESQDGRAGQARSCASCSPQTGRLLPAGPAPAPGVLTQKPGMGYESTTQQALDTAAAASLGTPVEHHRRQTYRLCETQEACVTRQKHRTDTLSARAGRQRRRAGRGAGGPWSTKRQDWAAALPTAQLTLTPGPLGHAVATSG